MNVNWNRINSFFTEGDPEEEEGIRDLIRIFISNYEKRLAELAEILKNKDNSQLLELLHQMKGMTSNFGFDASTEVITQAEIFAKEDNIDLSLATVSRLAPLWLETRAELKNKLGV